MNSRQGDAEDADELNEINKLRPLLDIDSLIVYTMGLAALVHVGPRKQRIGVFGPYGPDGDRVINAVAKLVASKGFAAITGLGYYRPNDQKNINDICHVVSEPVKRLYEKFFSPIRLWSNLPRITVKSVVNLTTLRTNLIEWQGCADNKISVLGFIVRNEIYRKETLENCDYLASHQSYSECVSPNISFCRFQRFCPFLSEPVRLPDVVRQVQMDMMGNRLIAVAQVGDLEVPLSEFLLKEETRLRRPAKASALKTNNGGEK